jgi:Protein of unknown function (DUF1579)
MIRIHALVTLLLIAASVAFAQAPAPTDEAHHAMAKLGYLVGSWKGSAAFTTGPSASNEATETETVASHLGGLVLVIEGGGKLMMPGGSDVDQSVRVISYDSAARHYQVVFYQPDGNSVVASGAFTADGKFQWGFKVDGRSIRHTMSFPNQMRYDLDEVSTDGQTWTQVAEKQFKRTP